MILCGDIVICCDVVLGVMGADIGAKAGSNSTQTLVGGSRK